MRSTHGGAFFASIPLSGISINQQDYDRIVGVDLHANKVYIVLRRLYFASDGGNSDVSARSEIDISSTHKNQHAIAFSPSSHITEPPPSRVYIGSDR
jgi:hypothetical protein